MSKINLLSSKIYNRISAGEVVERPASVVKELVENSIDAGANKISVEIYGGGISSIKITDNGSGIEKSELKKALLPHATSKISKLDDLDNILTLGFRGEALASIASVSKISIISKPIAQENGARIYAEGGEIDTVTDYPFVNGTEIEVNNLFYNTPAREKFLKKPKSEENEITSVITKLILGNPDIAFIYTVDSKKILQSFGDGLESAMISVFGEKVISDCFYVDTVKNGLHIKGYIGKHYFTKSNRGYQCLYINSRYVINQTIATAIHNAYSAYLMKRQYPFYVLSVSLPTELVDVNVHPNKTDVRFSNNEIIYGSFYSVISKVLDGLGEALNIVYPVPSTEKTIENSKDFGANYVRPSVNDLPKETYKFDTLVFNDSAFHEEKKDNNSVDIFAENKAYLEQLEKKGLEETAINLPKKEEFVQQSIEVKRNLRCVGQVLETYLVFDDGNDVYMVDQHAAHERILYDKFMAQVRAKNVDIQPLLIPYVFDVNLPEYEFLTEKKEILSQMGIDIEEFGEKTIKVSAIPAIISTFSLKNFFDTLLADLFDYKNLSLDEVLKEKIAQKACKSAIKAGDTLSQEDIKVLTDVLSDNLGLKCPHGRPVVVKITKTEIEKWFKRIV